MNEEKQVKRLLSLGEHRLRLIQSATALAAHPDGRSFFTAAGATIHQWSTETGEIVKAFYIGEEASGPPLFLIPTEESGQHSLMWSDSQNLINVKVPSNTTMAWVRAPKGEPLLHMNISRDGKRAVFQKTSEISFWLRDVSGARIRFSLPSSSKSPCVWLFPGGEKFLVATEKMLRCYVVWDEQPPGKTRQHRYSLCWEVPFQSIFCGAILSDKSAAFIDPLGLMKCLALDSGALIWSRQLSIPKGDIVTNNAGLIGVATEGGLWVLSQEGEERQHIPETIQARTLLALSSLGDWLVSCDPTRGLRLFGLPQGKESFPKSGHQSEIERLAWLGGKVLSTAKDDKVVRRWNLSSSGAEWLFEVPEIAEIFPLPDASGLLCRHKDERIALYSADGEAQQEIQQELSKGGYLGALSPSGDVFYLVQKTEGGCWLSHWSIAEWREQRRKYEQDVLLLAAVSDGLWMFSARGYSLLSDGFVESHRVEIPHEYLLHDVVVIEQGEALGIWSWAEKVQDSIRRVYALRRWDLRTGSIRWSTRFSFWRAAEVRLLPSSSKKYVASYNSKELVFYSLKTGRLIEQHYFSNEWLTGIAASQHQSLLAVGYNNGALIVYDASSLESQEEPEALQDQGWVAEFFAAKSTEERATIFGRFWEALSAEWKQAFLTAYPPLASSFTSEVMEAFLRDELELRICGATIEVEARPDHWANPEGYPDYEYVYSENSTLEPLRFLQNVVYVDCSISRVTSLVPLRGLPKLRGVETKGCNIRIK